MSPSSPGRSGVRPISFAGARVASTALERGASLNAERDARAVLFAANWGSDMLGLAETSPEWDGNADGHGDARRMGLDDGVTGCLITEREMFLADDEWQLISDSRPAEAEEALDAAVRGEKLRKLRAHLDQLRVTAPDDYRVMAMYWGLDGQCVSTIAAIAHKLQDDRRAVESTVLRVMADLRHCMGVKETGRVELRVQFSPERPPVTGALARRSQARQAA